MALSWNTKFEPSRLNSFELQPVAICFAARRPGSVAPFYARPDTTERINRSRSSFHGVRNGGRRRKFIRCVDDFSTKDPSRRPSDPFQMSPRVAHRGLARVAQSEGTNLT